ncbi:inositol monophosphatase family protein [Granulicoccus phenolivorans]|uniref:inositol monophosphatase family protein n=1 Tax=Granulicoccus phenolivorans TaxID=266854 RepID=UPI00041A91D4|nr:inositol monophosphatase [Granulicoccus phenolivorans]
MQTDEVLDLLRDVADEVVRPRFRKLATDEIAEKNPGDFVTIADRESEDRIEAALRAAYPQAVIVGEEATAADPGLLTGLAHAEHAFVIDPIDGTKNFVNGKDDYAVMVGEVQRGETVRGWIWQPEHQVAYVAEKGAGARRNGEPLHVGTRDRQTISGATSHRRWIGQQPAGVAQPIGLTWLCCGVDYPKLIEGAVDFILYRGMKPWDHVPGTLLLTEAGGVARSFDGEDYRAVSHVPPLLAAADAEIWELARAGLHT